MPRLNLNVDEGTLLKAYSIGTLNPRKWEVVNHDFEPTVPTSLLSPTSLADRESDALGLGTGRNVRDMDMETKASVMLTSKQFDPSVYLSTVHPNATYHDLAKGVAYLENSIEARSEALRVLVEDNFDHFVAVKMCTESLYADMKEGILDTQSEGGSRPLRDHLKLSAQKANQIYLPVLESAEKANKLRTTLGLFSRSRFFFNLPTFILESVEAGRYEVALRDYKKGKYLLENRPGQLLPIVSTTTTTDNHKHKASNSNSITEPTAASTTATSPAQQQQRRILDKVWLSVEKAMGEMRKALVARLVDGTRGVEELEKILDMLLEIKSHEDPLWVYFDSQHNLIMEKMNKAYLGSAKLVEERNEQYSSRSSDELDPILVDELRVALAAVETKQPDGVAAKSCGEPAWQAILDTVKGITEVVSSSLPTFWKMAQSFIDGKFKTANTTQNSRRSPTQCRTMTLDIIKLYISLLSELFHLTSTPTSALPTPSSLLDDLPKLIPRHSHALCTAHYLQKILTEIQECVVEIFVLEVSNEVNGCVKELMECVKWRFGEVGIAGWLRDARFFHRLEGWTRTPQTPHYTNHLLHFETFQRQMCIASYKIATGTDFKSSASASNSTPLSASFPANKHGGNATPRPNRRLAIPQASTQKLTKAFLDAFYGFLDGLVYLATENGSSESAAEGPGGSRSNSQSGMGRLERQRTETTRVLEKILDASRLQHRYEGGFGLVDLGDQTVRLLLVICNLNALADVFIPSILSQFEGAFNVTLSEDRATLTAVVSELDRTLFESYLQPKIDYITARLRDAILGGDIDWYREPPPTAVRPYVYDVLNFLVDVHSEIYGIAETLLERVLTTLVDSLVNEATESFKQVRKFGTGGLLLAVLELKLIHKSLGFYVKPETSDSLMKLYNKQIPKAYIPPATGPNVQDYLDGVDQLLLQTRRACAIQFLCFKQAKGSSSKDKEKGVKKMPSSAGGGGLSSARGTASANTPGPETPSTAVPYDLTSSPRMTPATAVPAGLTLKTNGLGGYARDGPNSALSFTGSIGSTNRKRNGSIGMRDLAARGSVERLALEREREGGDFNGGQVETPPLPSAVPSFLNSPSGSAGGGYIRGRSDSVSSSTSKGTTASRGERRLGGNYI